MKGPQLVLQALSVWAKAQVVHLSPSFEGLTEESAWIERLSKIEVLEDDLIALLDSESASVVAYLLVTLERMGSPKLRENLQAWVDRREKITLLEGSFSTSMDLGGLARKILKDRSGKSP